ncbi:MAG: BatD family protein [Bacteroidales bacterium]|nr:BatD family protein [Bacteroidales bacterium]
MNKLLVILTLITASLTSVAQDVEFISTAPNVVAEGEQFRLVFKLNSRPKSINPPAFDNFYVLAGPSTSSSSSIQVVNGQMTQTYEYTYTYILEASKEGKFTIPPAIAKVNNKEYESNSLTIEVVKGSSGTYSAQNQRQSQNQNQTPSQQKAEGSDKSSDVFVSIDFDKTNVYRGEPILATISIYTRQGISGFEDVKFPSFTGFWSQEVETANEVHFQRVNIDGRIYNMGVLKKYLLFPQRSGEITVDPFEIVVLTQEKSGRTQSIFDDFFGTYKTIKQRLVSKPKTIKVKDLPSAAPASFTGAVGNYNLEASLDKAQVKTNEAVNLKIRVAGSGNLRLLDTPKFDFPAGFEVFDTKVLDRISTTKQGATGSKTFDIVAIPRAPGDFDLGVVEFSYFNPLQNKYVTLKSKPLTLFVDSDGSEASNVPMAGFGREDIRFIGQDIRFIKTDKYVLQKSIAFLISGIKYKLIIIVLLGLSVAAYWWIQRRRSLMSNIALVRTRKAKRVSKQRLKIALQFLKANNAEQFHDELLRALWGYISDKLSIPVANLSSDTARVTLLERGVNTIDIEEFLRIVSICEYARYAPKGEQSQMANLYDSSIELISKLEAVLNGK